jgi:hypothetical protein
LGITTTGFFDSCGGGLTAVVEVVLGVVVLAVVVAVAAAAVDPEEGASWTPGAFELPQAATPNAVRAMAGMVRKRIVINGR